MPSPEPMLSLPCTRRDALCAAALAGAGRILLHAPLAALSPESPPVTPAAPLLRRPIPSTGESLPAIGLGTWRTFDVGDAANERAPLRRVLERFAALGGRLLDSSPMYGRAERVAGELAAELGLGSRLFLATKVWTSGRAAGIAEMERSSRLLGRPVLDLLQVHNLLDVDVQLATLREWKRQGRVRYVGVTHYHAGAHAELARVVRAGPLDFLQVNYSPFEPGAGRELLPLAAERGVAVLANRPFGGGEGLRSLLGRPLPDFAAELGATSWAQLVLKWILADPAVTCAIPATSSVRHLEDDLAAARGPLPDAALRRRIAALVA